MLHVCTHQAGDRGLLEGVEREGVLLRHLALEDGLVQGAWGGGRGPWGQCAAGKEGRPAEAAAGCMFAAAAQRRAAQRSGSRPPSASPCAAALSLMLPSLKPSGRATSCVQVGGGLFTVFFLPLGSASAAATDLLRARASRVAAAAARPSGVPSNAAIGPGEARCACDLAPAARLRPPSGCGARWRADGSNVEPLAGGHSGCERLQRARARRPLRRRSL